MLFTISKTFHSPFHLQIPTYSLTCNSYNHCYKTCQDSRFYTLLLDCPRILFVPLLCALHTILSMYVFVCFLVYCFLLEISQAPHLIHYFIPTDQHSIWPIEGIPCLFYKLIHLLIQQSSFHCYKDLKYPALTVHFFAIF